MVQSGHFLADFQKLISHQDARMRNRLQLFKGIRSKKEDTYLLIKFYGHLLAEMWLFLEEHLTGNNREDMETDLKQIPKIAEDDKWIKDVLVIYLKYLKLIPDGMDRLDSRLNHYLNNLIIKSLTSPRYGKSVR